MFLSTNCLQLASRSRTYIFINKKPDLNQFYSTFGIRIVSLENPLYTYIKVKLPLVFWILYIGNNDNKNSTVLVRQIFKRFIEKMYNNNNLCVFSRNIFKTFIFFRPIIKYIQIKYSNKYDNSLFWKNLNDNLFLLPSYQLGRIIFLKRF